MGALTLTLDPELGVAACESCGWRGVPSRVTVRRGPPRWDGSPAQPRVQPVFPVLESRVVPACPACHEGENAPPPGRNAPCGCGSGVKFKKCCGR